MEKRSEEVQARLNEYFEKQEALKKQRVEERKKQDLIERGLYTIKKTTEYQEGGIFDSYGSQFITKVPLDVTDEEYEKIKQYEKEDDDIPNSTIGLFLYSCGFIFLLGGIILGSISGFTNDSITGFIIILVSILFSLIYFGLAEVIKLLMKLIMKQKGD